MGERSTEVLEPRRIRTLMEYAKLFSIEHKIVYYNNMQTKRNTQATHIHISAPRGMQSHQFNSTQNSSAALSLFLKNFSVRLYIIVLGIYSHIAPLISNVQSSDFLDSCLKLSSISTDRLLTMQKKVANSEIMKRGRQCISLIV